MSGSRDKAFVRAVSALLMVRNWRATLLFWHRVGRLPRLSPPELQNDKFFWRKTIDHNPLFEIFCDKTACKEWVRERCSGIIVPKTIWSGNSAGEIPDHVLTRKVILKANNGSGANIVINGEAPDRAEIETRFKRWLARPYGQEKSEWGYHNVPRTMFAETLITGPDGSPPIMVEVTVLSGKPAVVYCIMGWKGITRAAGFFDVTGDRLEIPPTVLDSLPSDWKLPAGFHTAIACSRILSRGIDCIRVDFMCIGETVWFSEMTPYTMSGHEIYRSVIEGEQVYGEWSLLDSWFLSTEHKGWKRYYAAALKRLIHESEARN